MAYEQRDNSGSVFLETKTEHGRASEAQIAFKSRAKAAGYESCIAYGFDNARNQADRPA